METILNSLLKLMQDKLANAKLAAKNKITAIDYVEAVNRLNAIAAALGETYTADPHNTTSMATLTVTSGYYDLFEELLTLCQNYVRAEELEEEQYSEAVRKLNEFATLAKFSYKADPDDFTSFQEDNDDDSYNDDSYGGSDSY